MTLTEQVVKAKPPLILCEVRKDGLKKLWYPKLQLINIKLITFL